MKPTIFAGMRQSHMPYKTVNQRKKVYQRIVNQIEHGRMSPYYGLCYAIYKSTGRFPYYISPSFPELYKAAPKNKKKYWWPLTERGLQSRKACLLRAIKLCDQ